MNHIRTGEKGLLSVPLSSQALRTWRKLSEEGLVMILGILQAFFFLV